MAKRNVLSSIGWTVLVLMVAGALSGKRGKASPRKPPRVPAPGSARAKHDPLGIRKRTAEAIASGDPARMRAFAAAIRAEGYGAEADQLEAAAAAAERRK